MTIEKTIVLASTSPVRKAILQGANIPFISRTVGVDEGAIKARLIANNGSVDTIALALARAKAEAVARSDHEVVIGADQILTMDGQVFNKPKNKQELRERLLYMRGRSHQLTGAQTCLYSDEKPWIYISHSTLYVRTFSEAWLDDYLDQEGDSVLYCVGGYRFEGLGAQLFEKIDGDYYAILGLELLPLMAHLRTIGALHT